MRVAVLGCGAIGGVVAACLTRAGVSVTPITGSVPIARAIEREGFRVRDLDGTAWSIGPNNPALVAIGDGGTGGALFDLVIVATRSTRLEEALRSIVAHLAPDGAVVLCQNGLPEDRAAPIVGARRVVGCVVGWGASMVEEGSYQRTSRGGLQLGAPVTDGGPGLDLGVIARLLDPVAPATVAKDFPGVRWSKLAINCCTSTLGAIGGAPLGALLRHRFVRRLALELFAEVSAVARAEGIRPARVGGTLDIASLAITDQERRRRLGSASLVVKHSVLLAIGFKFRRMRSSMLYSLERGRTPEIDDLNGEIVRRGDARGVPVPVNRALAAAVEEIAAGRSRSDVATLRAIHLRLLGGAQMASRADGAASGSAPR